MTHTSVFLLLWHIQTNILSLSGLSSNSVSFCSGAVRVLTYIEKILLNSSVLTSYLTNGLTSLERFPISFKTQFSGHCFHHVVLGVYCNGRYGSLGMSRRQDLMDKPLTHRTLGELVAEFESSYKRYQHTLKKVREGGGRGDGLWRQERRISRISKGVFKPIICFSQVKIGLYVPHDPHVFQPIEWKHLVLNAARLGAQEMRKELEKHGRDMRMKVHIVYTHDSTFNVCFSFQGNPTFKCFPVCFLYWSHNRTPNTRSYSILTTCQSV